MNKKKKKFNFEEFHLKKCNGSLLLVDIRFMDILSHTITDHSQLDNVIIYIGNVSYK